MNYLRPVLALAIIAVFSSLSCSSAQAAGEITLRSVSQSDSYIIGQSGEIRFSASNMLASYQSQKLIIDAGTINALTLRDANGLNISLTRSLVYDGFEVPLTLDSNETRTFTLTFSPQRIELAQKITISILNEYNNRVQFTFKVVDPVIVDNNVNSINIGNYDLAGVFYEFQVVNKKKEYALGVADSINVNARNLTRSSRSISPTPGGDNGLSNVRMSSSSATSVNPLSTATLTVSFVPKATGVQNIYLNFDNYPTLKIPLNIVKSNVIPRPYNSNFDYLDNDLYFSGISRKASYVRDRNTGKDGYLIRFTLKNKKAVAIQKPFTVHLQCTGGNYEDSFQVSNLAAKVSLYNYSFLVPKSLVNSDCNSFKLEIQNTSEIEMTNATSNNSKRYYFKKSGSNYQIFPSQLR